ncbi:MAG: hypothetical protein NVS3B7_06990 [Candidatus Elarobacter sp.]
MRFAVGALVLLAAAAPAGASAPPADPLAAVAAAAGHAAAVHVRATAAGTYEGRRVEVTLDQLGTARLLRRCVAEVCGGSWFDGTRRWTFSLNEVLLPEDDDPLLPQRRTLAALDSYAFAEPAFGTAGGTVVSAGANAWRVRAPGGATLIGYLDPVTHLLRRVANDGGGTIEVYDNAVRAGAASFALQRRGLDEFAAGAATSVAGPVEPPAGPEVTFAGDGVLALGADPVPIVPCRLGERTVRCLLDSGATPSAIALPLAEALGLEARGEIELTAFANVATGFVEAGPLRVGAARFDRVRFAVVGGSSAAAFDVVVGADLLARVRLVLDRGRRAARLVAPGGDGALAPGATVVPLAFHDGTPRLRAELDGVALSALFDTGDQSVLSIGYAAYRLGPQWPMVARALAVGMGSAAEDAFTVDVPDVRIGPFAAGRTRATVRRTQTSPHVGIGLWDRSVIELDESSSRLVLRPR